MWLEISPPIFENTLESPDLAKYLDVVYEDSECVPGVCYRTVWMGKVDVPDTYDQEEEEDYKNKWKFREWE